LSDRLSPEDLPPIETLVEDMLVVLDAVGSNRTALFAFSDSACVCSMFAGTYPERTSALALYATAARGLAAPDFPWQWTEAEWDEYFEEMRRDWGTRAYAAKAVPWFNPSLTNDDRTIDWWARNMRLSASPSSAVAIERIWHEIDIRAILPTIRVPTLVMHRIDDAIEDVEAGRDIASRIPGARFIELPGGDNAPWAGDQDAVLSEVEGFLHHVREEEAELDRVLATVLFTDIVGSTKRAAELGDRAWHELLERHHSEVRTQLARYHGVEIDTAGDGFFATFDGPARAVRCAQAIVEAVRALELEVRVGVHTGEVETIDRKVGGIAVNIGARVGGMAGPSEVLVSSTVKDLVAGSGLVFQDRGEHALKGIPDRWHLYGVVP
jgi:class 3 adenylate cyclase